MISLRCVGVPTDTLYGLAGDSRNKDAIETLYRIKGRSSSVPLAVSVSKTSEISSFCEDNHLPVGLLDSLLPGPITVVLRRKTTSLLSPDLNPGTETIGILLRASRNDLIEFCFAGVRVPGSDFICDLCDQLGCPVALTSANLSGRRSSVRITDFKELWNECSIVFDGGEIDASSLGSTVVDLTTRDTFKILREGDGLSDVLDQMRRFSIQQS